MSWFIDFCVNSKQIPGWQNRRNHRVSIQQNTKALSVLTLCNDLELDGLRQLLTDL